MCVCCAILCLVTSRVQFFVTPWTVAHQGPLSMGILQARILSGLPCSPPGHPPNPGIKPRSPTLQVDSLPSEPPGKPWTFELNSPIHIHFNSLIPKILMFILAFSCLATSSLTWFMELIFHFPCNIVLYSIGFSPWGTSMTGIISTLAQPLHSFWSCFSAFPQ